MGAVVRGFLSAISDRSTNILLELLPQSMIRKDLSIQSIEGDGEIVLLVLTSEEIQFMPDIRNANT